MSERFGQYELIDKIAAGGMAEIFFARLVGVQGFARNVVVKRMLPELSVRPDFVEMFLDEARLAANLNHPNLVQVYDLGQLDDAYFMAMEFIDGPHLGSLFAHSLRQGKPLPVALCAWIVARAADGLGFAHEAHHPDTGQPMNIVHRDISPQNILISKHGDVKVTDFGVAKTEVQHTKTRTGIIKGKVAYMSPEQCLADAVDNRTDVFALGICLYELLTRRRLYKEKSDLKIMTRITQEQAKPPSALNADVDDALDQICLKALEKATQNRFQTMAEFSQELDKWLLRNNHTGGKKQLSSWIAEHAPEVGPTIKKKKREQGEEGSGLSGQWAQSSDLKGNVGRTPATGSFNAALTLASNPRKNPPYNELDHSEATQAMDVNTFSDTGAYTQEVSTGMILAEQDDDTGAALGAGGALSQPSVIVEQKSKKAAYLGLLLLLLLLGLGSAVAYRMANDVSVGGIDVATVPSGAAVLLNGNQMGQAPLHLEVEGATARVGVQFAGEPLQERNVTLNPGEKLDLKFFGRIALKVTSEPSGALVYVDQVLKGETPLPAGLTLAPNQEVTVEIKKDGYETWSKTVKAVPGKPVTFEPKLTRKAPPKPKRRASSSPSPAGKKADPIRAQAGRAVGTPKTASPANGAQPSGFGSLTLNTQPWTTVRIGNRILGDTPVYNKKLKAGRHTLNLSNPEMGIVMELPVTIESDQTFKKQIRISTGKINFTKINPGATIRVDGKPLGKTPLSDFSVYPGNHTVEVTENGVRRSLKVKVKPGRTTTAK